jgi:hypothetical protein
MVVVLLSVAGVALADQTLISMLPTTKTGFAVNCAKNAGNVCIGIEEAELACYKGVSVNLGAATQLNADAKGVVAASLNYNLGSLTNYGINVPQGDKIEVGLFADRDFDTRTFAYGPCVMAKIKFQ